MDGGWTQQPLGYVQGAAETAAEFTPSGSTAQLGMCLLVAVLLSKSMLAACMVHSGFHGTITGDIGTPQLMLPPCPLRLPHAAARARWCCPT